MKYDTVNEKSIIYLFPSLKALFLWVNLEFALRYAKTAQIMKLMFHPDPIKQCKAQEPARVQKRMVIDCGIVFVAIFAIIAETVLVTTGFVCIDKVVDAGAPDWQTQS